MVGAHSARAAILMSNLSKLEAELKPMRDEAVALLAKWELDLAKASNPNDVKKLRLWISNGTAALAKMDAKIAGMKR